MGLEIIGRSDFFRFILGLVTGCETGERVLTTGEEAPWETVFDTRDRFWFLAFAEELAGCSTALGD